MVELITIKRLTEAGFASFDQGVTYEWQQVAIRPTAKGFGLYFRSLSGYDYRQEVKTMQELALVLDLNKHQHLLTCTNTK